MIQPIGASERERNGPGSVEGRGLRPGPGVEAMMNSFEVPRERTAPRKGLIVTHPGAAMP
jgi:hypothetical protein